MNNEMNLEISDLFMEDILDEASNIIENEKAKLIERNDKMIKAEIIGKDETILINADVSEIKEGKYTIRII